MLHHFIVIGKHVKMDFGDWGVAKDMAGEVAALLLKLTTTQEKGEELILEKAGLHT